MKSDTAPTDGDSWPVANPSVLAVAGGRALQRRIVDALGDLDVRVTTQADVDQNEDLSPPVESTVVVFACDINAPREMANLRRLCRETPRSAVIVVTSASTGTGVRRALDAGASGVVFEPDLERTLVTAVRAVAIGQSVVPRKLRAGVERPVLSHRERQVLELVRKGLTNAQIAERLFLAESTIKSHLASLFAKFGVHSRKEVAIAVEELERVSLSASPTGKSAEQLPA